MRRILVIATVLCCAVSLAAQELPEKPRPQEHRFFDKTNKVLFTGLVVTRALDYHSTYAMLKNGGVESPWSRGGVGNLVKSKPGFAVFQAASVGATMGVAYWLHRKGHHRWERVVSIVQISGIGWYAAKNYRLARRDFR